MFHGIKGHGWGMSWDWIIGLLILIVMIWLVVRLVNQNNQTPLDILKERYAKGEIDKTEFEERKKDIS